MARLVDTRVAFISNLCTEDITGRGVYNPLSLFSSEKVQWTKHSNSHAELAASRKCTDKVKVVARGTPRSPTVKRMY